MMQHTLGSLSGESVRAFLWESGESASSDAFRLAPEPDMSK